MAKKQQDATHVKGIKSGNAKGNYESMSGHNPDGTSTAQRSTGINAADAQPIDPSMPNLSPGWTRVTLVDPAFERETTVDLDVPCSYDLEVAGSRYLDALSGGDVPLELLFSGSVFYEDGGRLQTVRLSWEKEAEYALPVRVWKETMERYFNGTAWLRLRKDSFDRLSAFKSRHALATWDDALDALLEG